MEGDRAARGGDPPPSEGDPVTTPLATKAPRLTWTDSRLQTLLHLRLIVYGDAFNKHKSRAQLTCRGSDDDAAASDWGGDAASDGDIAVGEIHDDSSSDEAGAAAVETEKDRHNSMKKRQKLDLPEAMVSMEH
ncbi:hypothetical protein GQ600_7433 [Phytophthora cactorum]|nr:hypothetical protein GQ600_7433 [Phytophthora cactorum]